MQPSAATAAACETHQTDIGPPKNGCEMEVQVSQDKLAGKRRALA